MSASGKTRVAVLISGRGSNMAALIEAARSPKFPAEIVAVVADRADAAGLQTARASGISAVAVERAGFADKASHEAALAAAIEGARADIVCLAGFMRILSAAFVARYRGRIVNIHPSLLPLFPGLDTHGRALAAGVRIHGCTVHFVTEGMDEGPIIAQAAVPVLPEDDAESLANRVLIAEHRLYPAALRLVAEGGVLMDGNGRARFAEPHAIRRVDDHDSPILIVAGR